jgi:hypothetical protein
MRHVRRALPKMTQFENVGKDGEVGVNDALGRIG